MPNTKRNAKNKIELLRNFRVVVLHRDQNMTFEAIAKLLESEGDHKISRQAVAQIYKAYREVPFIYEDDKVIIS